MPTVRILDPRRVHAVPGETSDSSALGPGCSSRPTRAQVGSGAIDIDPFITALHIAFGVGVVASLLGAVVSASRGKHEADEAVVSGSVAA